MTTAVASWLVAATQFCAPTRSSIQSGRNPIHVNVQNYQPVVWDSADKNRDVVSGYAGIPTKMTGVSRVLKNAGYVSRASQARATEPCV